MINTETIEYKGFSLQISFDYDKGWKGSHEEPPEPASIEIEKVMLLCARLPSYEHWNGINLEVDITDLLGEEKLKEIEQLLWDKKEDF